VSRNFNIFQRDVEEQFGVKVSVSVEAMPPAGKTKVKPTPAGASTTIVADEITQLVQQLFLLACPPTAPQAVTFSASKAGDGCSWVCARSAEALAAQDIGAVCVVDANLRTPTLHQHFKINNGFGLADSVYDSKPISDFAVRDGFTNLWVVPAGNVGRNPNAVLNMTRLRNRFAELKADFEYVIIDTAPIATFGDAALIGKLTDGIVLVVGSNSAHRDCVRVAKQKLQSAQIPILGAVLNRREFPMPEQLYRRI
jgi:protein-tyrosine kinase